MAVWKGDVGVDDAWSESSNPWERLATHGDGAVSSRQRLTVCVVSGRLLGADIHLQLAVFDLH